MSLFISAAHAAGEAVAPVAAAGSAGEAFMMNMLLILMLVGLFYIMLIRPQQKRFKEHRAMLDDMKKGDKVLTAAGFLGTVDSVNAEKGEGVVDLGNGVEVTALRATIQMKIDDKK